MNVIAIMNTGNDEDIVELSVRHNLKYLSKIIIIDNNSQDETKEIINKLSQEFPKSVYVVNVESNTPTEHILNTNFFKQQIIDFDNPDYLFILDADEFIKCDNLEELKLIPEGHVGNVSWQCYIPNKLDHKNYPEEMTHRRDHEPEGCHKVVLPKGVNGCLILGNHYLHQGQNSVRAPSYNLKTITLAHYPVRSIKQMNKKIEFVTNFLKYEDPRQSYHLRRQIKLDTLEDLIDKALKYADIDKEVYTPVLDPL